MIDIAFLADRTDVIPILSQWFTAQWPDYFAAFTDAEIAAEFRAEANRDRIPVRLLAFACGELAGTICLRERAISSQPDYRPGLGGLLVAPQYRGRGIGTELVVAGTQLAGDLGYASVYTTTVTARGILARLGWALMKSIAHDDEDLALFRYTIA